MENSKENQEGVSDMEIERCNIVHLMKLIVKDILRVAVKCNRQIPEDSPLIVQLVRILESVIKHGLKPRRVLGAVPIVGVVASTDPWPMVCDLMRREAGANVVLDTVNQMGIKTGAGRVRAWLKMALMQKQLGNYFHIITNQSKKLETYYYPAAVLLQETGVEIYGLLVGLSVVECNFLKFKECTLEMDSYIGPLNYSIYMCKDFDEINSLGPNEIEFSDEIFKNLLDQKNYIEELNSILQLKLTKLQNNYNVLEKETSNIKLSLAESKNINLSLTDELNKLKAENDFLKCQYDHKNKLMQDDIQVERFTYQTSRQELNQLNLELEKKLKEEIQIRLDSDKTLQSEVQRRSDVEIGMGTLEKQIQEKQQTILSLRKQMEEIKTLNIELNKDLKEKQSINDHKSMLVDKLEEKTTGMASIIDQMDQRIKKYMADKTVYDKNILQLQTVIENCKESCSLKEKDIIKLNEEIMNLKGQIEKLNKENEELSRKLTKISSQLESSEYELSQSELRFKDQAEALEEMAKILENSKLETDDLREMQASFQEARWTDDKEVNQCNQCTKPFNVSRRKHHCRRCGGVFCHDCSNNRMSLASAAKPVRVCDTCHSTLLKNFTSMGSRNENDD